MVDQAKKQDEDLGKPIGVVTHYFSRLGVGIVKLEDSLKVGDKVRFIGHTTDFEQEVKEMQLEHKPISLAEKGQEVGVKVNEKLREHDKVYLIV